MFHVSWGSGPLHIGLDTQNSGWHPRQIAMIRSQKKVVLLFCYLKIGQMFVKPPKRIIMKLIACLLCNSSYPNLSHSYHIVSNIYIYSNQKFKHTSYLNAHGLVIKSVQSPENFMVSISMAWQTSCGFGWSSQASASSSCKRLLVSSATLKSWNREQKGNSEVGKKL